MSHTAASVATLDRHALLDLMQAGHPIEPAALDDSEYRGISLGLPAPVVALTSERMPSGREPLSPEP